MLVDEAEIIVRAGHGGAGKVSFYPGLTSGPDGGNGGRGGDVYIQATSDLTALRQFTTKRLIQAENGQPGGSNRQFGKDGADREIWVPLGGILENPATKEIIEITQPDERMLICQGGLGGRGNFEFKSSRNTTPEFAQPGLSGEEKHLLIHLKLIAKYGLVGLPNSGKSSLLNELTKANVKTAAYPFTTLEPNLGSLNGIILADIPGLIEGASSGKGLGIKFLKHVEKTSTLLHCISADSDDVNRDYLVIRKELEQFSPGLIQKQEIILLTKSDLVNKHELEKKLKILKKLNPQVYPISIHDWDSLEGLKKILLV